MKFGHNLLWRVQRRNKDMNLKGSSEGQFFRHTCEWLLTGELFPTRNENNGTDVVNREENAEKKQLSVGEGESKDASQVVKEGVVTNTSQYNIVFTLLSSTELYSYPKTRCVFSLLVPRSQICLRYNIEFQRLVESPSESPRLDVAVAIRECYLAWGWHSSLEVRFSPYDTIELMLG